MIAGGMNSTWPCWMRISHPVWCTCRWWVSHSSTQFQSVLGYSALQTGLAFLLPTAFIVMGSAIGGQLATRFGLRATLTASLAIGSAGALATGLAFASDGSYAALITGLILLSVGDGIVYTIMFIAAGTGVSERESGIASGIASVGTQVGSAVGLAVLVAIANSGTEGLAGEALRVATTDGLRIGVFAAAGIAATILIALSIKKPQPSTDPASQAPAITHLPGADHDARRTVRLHG